MRPPSEALKPCTISNTPDAVYADGREVYHIKTVSKAHGVFTSRVPGKEHYQSAYIANLNYVTHLGSLKKPNWYIVYKSCCKLNTNRYLSGYKSNKDDALKELKIELEARGYELVANADN